MFVGNIFEQNNSSAPTVPTAVLRAALVKKPVSHRKLVESGLIMCRACVKRSELLEKHIDRGFRESILNVTSSI